MLSGNVRCNVLHFDLCSDRRYYFKQGTEAAAFLRSTDRTLFPTSSYPDEIEDATSGEDAPDLELFSSPYAWFDHNSLHPKIPMVDVGTVAAVLLRYAFLLSH